MSILSDYAHARVVLLARHPGDIAVSRHHHLRHRSRGQARRRLAEQPLELFVWDEHGGIPSIVRFMNLWAELSRQRAGRDHRPLRRFPGRSSGDAEKSGRSRSGSRSPRPMSTMRSISPTSAISRSASARDISVSARLQPAKARRQPVIQGPRWRKRRLPQAARSARGARRSTDTSPSISIPASAINRRIGAAGRLQRAAGLFRASPNASASCRTSRPTPPRFALLEPAPKRQAKHVGQAWPVVASVRDIRDGAEPARRWRGSYCPAPRSRWHPNI